MCVSIVSPDKVGLSPWLYFGRLLPSGAALGECGEECEVCLLHPGAGPYLSVTLGTDWPVLVYISANLGFPYVNSHELDVKSHEHGNSK